jgi:hypothetical protein
MEDEVATMPPVDESWRPPFAGQPVEKTFEYLATVSLEKSLRSAYEYGLRRFVQLAHVASSSGELA